MSGAERSAAVLPASRLAAPSVPSAAAPLPPIAIATAAAALDGAVCLLAPLLAGLLADGAPPPGPLHQMMLLFLLLTLGFTAFGGGYAVRGPGWRAGGARGGGVRPVLHAALAALGAVLIQVQFMPQASHTGGRWAIITAILATSGLAAGRALLSRAVAADPKRRFAPRVVVVGRPAADRLMAAFGADAPRLLGFVADAPARTRGLPRLGPVEHVFAMIAAGQVDQVVITPPAMTEAQLPALLARLADHPVPVRLALALPASAAGRLSLVPLMDRPISGWASLLKRAEDIVLAVVLLGVFAAPMALIAGLVRLTSPGPALFRQRRIGFGGQGFDLLKFRTMHHHLAEPRIARQAFRGDPRVTPFGAWLRRRSFDELPQLFNVLRGQMSLVGPRPHAPGTPAAGRPFEAVIARYGARHRVKPGLTGLAQVRGLRGLTETEDKLVRRVQADFEYIENWSLWLDLLILARTAVSMLGMRNAC